MMETVYPDLKKHVDESGDALGALVVPAVVVQQIEADGADLLLIVLSEREGTHGRVSTYAVGTWKVKEVRAHSTRLAADILSGDRPGLVHCFRYGNILYDPDKRIHHICSSLEEFPHELRSKKSCIEFSRLLKNTLETKAYLNKGYLLDAYVTIQNGLQHWGRLAVIDAGQYPHIRLWNQVKPLSPGIYKLYQELVHGNDSLEQRMELVLLAVEYSILSNLTHYCAYILELMAAKPGMWSVEELSRQLALEQMELDLTLLLEELVKRSVLEEVLLQGDNKGQPRYRIQLP
ncbi:nucleotidyltransferase-like protein [Salinithrix halophila]|uniref:Nucleotidyltransferase-like protein n=1 Tax=Salinithrix halophila TaxID=1485204 RepID=A0ABV8JIX2_9BACL